MPLLLPILHSMSAMAQAGGGGSFGGGGGGGGDGGDLAGLLIHLLYYLIRFAIEVPILGVPLLILVAFGVCWLWSQGVFEVKRRKIRKFRRPRRRVLSAQSSELLQETDPEFDEAAFLGRVKSAFIKAQDSWCAQDLAPLSTFVSDGIHERFSLQIEEQQLEGWRQGMKETTIRSAHIADVCIGEQFDSLTVRISFSADIHRLELDSGKRIGGSELPRTSFAEAWTFLRGHGTKTLNADGLMEGQCPNCGAELLVLQSARCEHCDCHVKSGQFDWVLAEITQWNEWTPESAESIPGLRSYKELDPAWHPQVMEDLVSVVFWRMTAADRRGSTDILHGHTTEAFLKKYGKGLKTPTKGSSRTYLSDCAVGSVRSIGLLAGAERDRVVIEVIWDGRLAEEAPDGSLEKSKRRSRRCRRFVFSRGAGAKTDHSNAFTTAHCRECGAHDDGGAVPNCRYCNAPRFGDPSLWLLEDVVSRSSEAGAGLLEELTTLRAAEAPKYAVQPRIASAMNLLRWAVGMVHADGLVNQAERSRIHAMAAHAGLTTEEADALLKVRAQLDDYPIPEDDATARAWIEQLIEVSLEDGRVSRKELRFLQHASRAMGIPVREYRRVLRSIHTELYKHSKTAQRRLASEAHHQGEPPAERASSNPSKD